MQALKTLAGSEADHDSAEPVNAGGTKIIYTSVVSERTSDSTALRTCSVVLLLPQRRLRTHLGPP